MAKASVTEHSAVPSPALAEMGAALAHFRDEQHKGVESAASAFQALIHLVDGKLNDPAADTNLDVSLNVTERPEIKFAIGDSEFGKQFDIK